MLRGRVKKPWFNFLLWLTISHPVSLQAKPIYGGWLCLAPEGTDFGNPAQRSRVRAIVTPKHTSVMYSNDVSNLFLSVMAFLCQKAKQCLFCFCFPRNGNADSSFSMNMAVCILLWMSRYEIYLFLSLILTLGALTIYTQTLISGPFSSTL